MSRNSQSKTPFKVQDDGGGLSPSSQSFKDKLDDLDNVVKAVILVLLFMVAGMIFATINIYIDQAHFNNETYDTYKIEQGTFQQQLTNLQNKNNNLQSQINTLKSKINP